MKHYLRVDSCSSMVVSVEADSFDEATDIVDEMIFNGDIIVDECENFRGFSVCPDYGMSAYGRLADYEELLSVLYRENPDYVKSVMDRFESGFIKGLLSSFEGKETYSEYIL